MLIETEEPLVRVTSVLPSHKFWDETWVARLDSKHLYLLSHFAGPSVLKFRRADRHMASFLCLR